MSSPYHVTGPLHIAGGRSITQHSHGWQHHVVLFHPVSPPGSGGERLRGCDVCVVFEKRVCRRPDFQFLVVFVVWDGWTTVLGFFPCRSSTFNILSSLPLPLSCP